MDTSRGNRDKSSSIDSVAEQLATLAVRELSGQDLALELMSIPHSFIEAALELLASRNERDDEYAAVLELLAVDPRDYVRQRVALRLREFDVPLPPSIEFLLQDLACDVSLAVRHAAAESLALILQRCEGFTRTRVVGSWALSSLTRQREAIAQALRWPFEAVGAPSAVEILAGDEDAEVRAAAAEAAKVRLREAPRVCNAILYRLAHDPDPAVRRAARLAPPQESQLNE